MLQRILVFANMHIRYFHSAFYYLTEFKVFLTKQLN